MATISITNEKTGKHFTAIVTTTCMARASLPRHRVFVTRNPVSEEPYEYESLKYGSVDQYAGRPAY